MARENAVRESVSEFDERTVFANGIGQHVTQAGSGPAVLLCHGFPELGYSWRHQLRALADAGYRAIAPDMRGYGRTGAPAVIDRYTILCRPLGAAGSTGQRERHPARVSRPDTALSRAP